MGVRMKFFLKRFLLVVLLFATVAARATALDDAYLAERDQLIDKYAALDKAGKVDDKVTASETEALADLQKKLEVIVDLKPIKGFASDSKLNFDTLFKTDEGFGALDALVYSALQGKATITVTSTALLQHWLVQHAHWWEQLDNIPQTLDAALRSEAFYTQAISADAAVNVYGTIAIKVPAGDHAVALLAARSQDLGPRLPDEILATIVGERLAFVISLPVEGAKSIPQCDKIWKATQDKLAALGDSKDENAGDRSIQVREDGDKVYRACFSKNLGAAPFAAALSRQVQAVIDLLPPH